MYDVTDEIGPYLRNGGFKQIVFILFLILIAIPFQRYQPYQHLFYFSLCMTLRKKSPLISWTMGFRRVVLAFFLIPISRPFERYHSYLNKIQDSVLTVSCGLGMTTFWLTNGPKWDDTLNWISAVTQCIPACISSYI